MFLSNRVFFGVAQLERCVIFLGMAPNIPPADPILVQGAMVIIIIALVFEIVRRVKDLAAPIHRDDDEDD